MKQILVKKKIMETIPFEALYKLNIHQNVNESLAYESLKAILELEEEKKRTALLSILLNGVMVKGAKLDEVVGLLKAALSLDNIWNSKKPIISLPNNEKVIGYTGSGKKGAKTINISTPAAIVAACCGVYVAKGCSHSTSSLTGSSDFLSRIGVNLNMSIQMQIDLLKSTKVSFFSIEATTPHFAEIYGGRFFVPHALSYGLAGLSLPINVDILLYGFSHPNVELAVDVFNYFGFKDVMVITTTEDGIHYIDEIGICGTLSAVGIKDGKLGRTALCPIAEELGIKQRYLMEDIRPKQTPEKNVKAAIDALCGKGNEPYIDVISANAGMLIYLAKKVKCLKDGYLLAKKCILSKQPMEKICEIVELSKGNAVMLKKYK